MDVEQLVRNRSPIIFLLPVGMTIGLVLLMCITILVPIGPLMGPEVAAEEGQFSEDPFPIVSLLTIMFGVASLGLPVAIIPILMQGQKVRIAREKRADDPAQLEQVFQAFLQQHILRLALIEGAALMNIVAYMLEGQMFTMILAVVMTGFVAVQIPGHATVVAWIHRFLEEVDQLRTEANRNEPT